MKTTDNRTTIKISHPIQSTQWIKTVKISLLLLIGLTSIFPLSAIADNQPPQTVGSIVSRHTYRR